MHWVNTDAHINTEKVTQFDFEGMIDIALNQSIPNPSFYLTDGYFYRLRTACLM